MDYKAKALQHVREVCPELRRVVAVGAPTRANKETIYAYDTPHLEHWLRGMKTGADNHKVHITFDALNVPNFYFSMVDVIGSYNLTLDGENQSEDFYKAYCDIVGIK